MTTAQRRFSRIVTALALLALPSVLGGALAIWLSRDHVSTRVDLTAVVDRLSIVIGGTEPTQLLDRAAFRSAQITHFSRVLLSRPAMLERMDPALSVAGQVPATAWTRLTHGPEIAITAPRPDLHTMVTIEPAQAATDGRIMLTGARAGSAVVIETGGGRKLSYLTLVLRGDGASADIDPSPLAYVTVVNGRIEGAEIHDAGPSERLRVKLSPSAPLIRVQGGPDAFGLGFEFAAAPPPTEIALVSLPIPVTRVDFERQGPSGKPVSTLLSDAEVQYLDYPSLQPRTVPASHFVRLDPEAAELTALALVRYGERAAIKLRLTGTASELRVRTESDASPIDLRLTRFEVLRHDPKLAALLLVVGWIVGTTLAARKLWKELAATGESA